MFKNQFLIAIRQLRKQKTASIINILGLSLGLTAFVLILEYVAFEWSYNSMFTNADRIYRVLVTGEEESSYFLPPGYGPVFTEQFSGVEHYLRVVPNLGDGVVSLIDAKQKKVFRESNTAYVDNSFTQFFEQKLLGGDTDLSAPQQMLISQSIAQKYFGEEDPVGRELRLDNQFKPLNYTIVGVFEDMPPNSDLRFDFLLSLQTLGTNENRNGNYWADPAGIDNGFANIFIELASDKDPGLLAEQATTWLAERIPEENLAVDLQPLSEIHLGGQLNDPFPTYSSQLFVFFLFLVAILILIIAWVNYINLSTAQALERAKAVGIRKVVGATRIQLIQLYLMETLLLSSIGIGIAFVLVALLQPAYNTLVNLPLHLSLFLNSSFAPLGAIVVILGALLSGSYVALVLTGFNPVQILTGKFNSSRKGLWVRKALVVSQFAVTISFYFGDLDFI